MTINQRTTQTTATQTTMQATAQAARKKLNQCPQCGDTLFAPVWSEHVKERCIRHLWNCDACGYAYESMVYLTPQVLDDAA